ncbi:hypothetical protein V6N13_142957 [Hibiscus sabdariffa]
MRKTKIVKEYSDRLVSITNKVRLLGHKFSWPELFGKKQAEAQATIQRDNPEVKVVILSPGRARLFDFCCNRVYLDVDGSGIVTKTPTVG